jgi:hypothetical protein
MKRFALLKRKATSQELRERRKARLKGIREQQRIEHHWNLIRSERLVIGDCTNLGSFKDLPRHEQAVRLLKRLAFLFGKQSFDPHKVPVWVDTYDPSRGLASGFEEKEREDANLYLLTYPWSEITCAGYVAEGPPASGMYEITAKGRGVVESNAVEVDDTDTDWTDILDKLFLSGQRGTAMAQDEV